MTQGIANKSWVKKSSITDSFTAVTSDYILFAGGVTDTDEAWQQVQSLVAQGVEPKSLLKKPTIIYFHQLTKVSANKHDTLISIRYQAQNKSRLYTASYRDTAMRNEIVDRLDMQLRSSFKRETRSLSLLQAMLTPLVGIGIIGTLTYIFYFMAQELAENPIWGVASIGRSGLMKNLLVWTLQLIRPTGVLILGGLLLLIALRILYIRMKNPPVLTELIPK